MLDQLLPIAGSLLSGFLVKKYSKHRGSESHRVASPIGAIITAGAIAAVTGDSSAIQDISTAGIQYGAGAIAVHTVAKNAFQFIGESTGFKGFNFFNRN